MAVGDVVSTIGITSYRPSAGVEVILLHLWRNDQNNAYYLYNGTISNYNQTGSSAASIGYQESRATVKIPITNTNYVIFDSSTAISGIQIK